MSTGPGSGRRTAQAFAERLSIHGDPERAAAEIGRSPSKQDWHVIC